MWSIPAASISSTASLASVSDDDSTFTKINREPFPLGDASSWATPDEVWSRMVPTTVQFGRPM